MCEKKDICFIDNTSLVEEHEDLYAGDGVHLQPQYSGMMLDYLKTHYLSFAEEEPSSSEA